jgi:hypothetical protein
MLSRNLYKVKKSPLSKKRKAIIFIVAGLAVVSITLGILRLNSFKPASGTKEEVKLETGDRPLKQDIVIYVNADGGLSLRSDRDPKSQRLELIPNGTKLEAKSELDGWYEVEYNGKSGWVSKQYVTTTAPVEDPTKSWTTFSGPSYKVKYQPGWRVQDYGSNETSKSTSIVAFSNQDLPSSIPAGTEFVAPVVFITSSQTIDEVTKSRSTISGVQAETITVAGQPATKYTYTAVSSNTQVTDIVMAASGKVYIFMDGGGYLEDLLKMLNTFTIG